MCLCVCLTKRDREREGGLVESVKISHFQENKKIVSVGVLIETVDKSNSPFLRFKIRLRKRGN